MIKVKHKAQFKTEYIICTELYPRYNFNKKLKLARIKINDILTHYIIRSDGYLFSDRLCPPGILIQRKIFVDDETKYKLYHLSVNNMSFTKLAHRLVAEAFIENPDNKPEVNHKDGKKNNNHESNLEWATSSENLIHAYNTGLKNIKYGEDSHKSKITKKKVINICRMLESNKFSIKEISEIIGCDRTIIENIKAKRSWIKVSMNFDIENHTCYASSVDGKYRLNETDVRDICEKLASGKYSVKSIAQIYSVGYSTISDIKLRKSWTKISKDYDFSNCMYNRNY